MAERRMFAKTIIDSDAFIDMPITARLLYYDLAMRADDDGFVNSPKKIMRMIGVSQDDLNILIMRKFIIPFQSGVVVIKHWRIHNYIRKDRYSETTYNEEKEQLSLDTNKAYTLNVSESGIPAVNQRSTNGIPTVDTGKDRLGKDSIGESESEPDGSKPTRHKYGAHKNVLLSDDELAKLKEEIPSYLEYIERLSEYVASTGKKYKSHFATIRAWARKDNACAPKADAKTEYQDYFDMVKNGEL